MIWDCFRKKETVGFTVVTVGEIQFYIFLVTLCFWCL